MKNYYSIAIPKPCHENWNTMMPTEKGKFCNSCSKTVVDFTKMDTHEIQDFIIANKNNRICGHFKQSQLDSINIYIPSQVLVSPKSFHKTFLLALLIAMGTSLFNCTNKSGNKQKIDSIEVIDTIKTSEEITFGEPLFNENDSILSKKYKTNQKKISNSELMVEGELAIETVGDIVIIENLPKNPDSIIPSTKSENQKL
ncbi:hypothetical protein ACFQ1R_04820 [Mariniflexile jejuense]|uniref:Uncharacterized protein n=1 Tax=Mariniflexile jejuense TaxID=1173582 RepID=A0ABW3JHW4_9FLAO